MEYVTSIDFNLILQALQNVFLFSGSKNKKIDSKLFKYRELSLIVIKLFINSYLGINKLLQFKHFPIIFNWIQKTSELLKIENNRLTYPKS